jgi:hypothetical protein
MKQHCFKMLHLLEHLQLEGSCVTGKRSTRLGSLQPSVVMQKGVLVMGKAEKPNWINVCNCSCEKKVLAKLTNYHEDIPPTAERPWKKNDMQEQELSVAAYQYAAHNHEDLQLKYVCVLYLHSIHKLLSAFGSVCNPFCEMCIPEVLCLLIFEVNS